MKAKLTESQVSLLKGMRTYANSEARNAAFTAIVASAKDAFGIPQSHKLATGSEDPDSPDYATLIRKKTGEFYPLGADGKWIGETQAAPEPAPQVHGWYQVEAFESLDDVLYDINAGDIETLDVQMSLPTDLNKLFETELQGITIVGGTLDGDLVTFVKV